MIGASLLFALFISAPYYARPSTLEADLQQLRAEVQRGDAEIEDWRAKLQFYLAVGELNEISGLIELMASTFPQDPAFQEAEMMFLSLEGRHDEAIAQGEQILRDHPEYLTIRANLGRVYLEAQQRARGVNLLLSALEQGPIRVADWGLLLEGLGLSTRRADPGNSEASAPSGANPDAVVLTLREKIAQYPEKLNLRYVLVVVLTRLGRYTEAHDVLAKDPELASHPEMKVFFEHTGAD